MNTNRDVEILKLIIKHCDEVKYGIEKYDLDFEKFVDDPIIKNGISMAIMQIGENSKRLSKELKKKYSQLPWVLIGDMRNRFAHAYDFMNEDVIWEVAEDYVGATL